MNPAGLRILMLCPRYLWAGGGSVDHARRLCEELAKLGHQVTLLCDEHPNPGAAAPKGVALRTLPRDTRVEEKAERRLSLENRRGFYRFSQWWFRSGRDRLIASGPWCPAVADPATYTDQDVVILLNAASAFSVLFGRVAGALSARTLVLPLFHVREPSGSWPIHRRLFRDVDLISTSTDYESRWLMERGWSEKRLHAIGPGADPVDRVPDPAGFRDRFNIPPESPVVLFLGRKVYNKGVVHVVQAMDRVWDLHPDAWLVLVGFSHNPPEWLEQYLQRCRHPAIARTVNLDNVSADDREDALAACTVMAAPSISDSFGIVYLDAWRHARPVIACLDTASASVVTHGKTGLLVPFGDVPAIGTAIRDLLRDPERAAAMGRNGREQWQTRHTWSEVGRRLDTVLRNNGEST